MSDAGLGHYKPAHEGHSKHEYEVFHVDFERVEIPFIIALWIFVSSLAKIGEYSFPIQSKFLQKEPRGPHCGMCKLTTNPWFFFQVGKKYKYCGREKQSKEIFDDHPTLPQAMSGY